MKNRKLMYVLLPVVAVVWGLVIYRFMGALDGGAEIKEGTDLKKPEAKGVAVLPDTFSLLLNYSDPFLTNLPQKRQEPAFAFRQPPMAAVVQKKSSGSEQTPVPEPVIWPELVYSGLIENKAKKSKIAMLRVGSSDFLLSEGYTAGSVKLIKLWQDSVQVEFRKEKRVVWRGK